MLLCSRADNYVFCCFVYSSKAYVGVGSTAIEKGQLSNWQRMGSSDAPLLREAQNRDPFVATGKPQLASL